MFTRGILPWGAGDNGETTFGVRSAGTPGSGEAQTFRREGEDGRGGGTWVVERQWRGDEDSVPGGREEG